MYYASRPSVPTILLTLVIVLTLTITISPLSNAQIRIAPFYIHATCIAIFYKTFVHARFRPCLR